MSLDWIILSYVAAFVVAVTGFYTANSIRRKNRADSVESLTNSAMKMLDAKDRDLETCKKEKALLNVYVAYLQYGILTLQTQIRSYEPPEWSPKTFDEFNENK